MRLYSPLFLSVMACLYMMGPSTLTKRIYQIVSCPKTRIYRLLELSERLKILGYPKALINDAVCFNYDEIKTEDKTAKFDKFIPLVTTYYRGVPEMIYQIFEELEKPFEKLFPEYKLLKAFRQPKSVCRSQQTFNISIVKKCGISNCICCKNLKTGRRFKLHNGQLLHAYSVNGLISC